MNDDSDNSDSEWTTAITQGTEADDDSGDASTTDSDHETSTEDSDGANHDVRDFLSVKHRSQIKFKNENDEDKWKHGPEGIERNIVLGAKMLFALHVIYFCIVAAQYVAWPRACLGKHLALPAPPTQGNLCSVGWFVCNVVSCPVLWCIFRKPKASHQPDLLNWYMAVFATTSFWFIMLSLPICGVSCERDTAECRRFKMYETGTIQCDLKGHTYLQLVMGWLAFTPELIPEYKMMKVVFFWAWGLIIAIACSIETETKDGQFRSQYDVFVALTFIFLLQYLNLKKKWGIEVGQRTKFMLDLQQNRAADKLGELLQNMVPGCYIAKLLRDPDQITPQFVARASIMFVKFVDFDEIALKNAREVLELLNEKYTRFDHFCNVRGVTKIETVGEEFVCAVGVLPDDIKEDRRHGHSAMLGRLLKVASDILELHEPTGIAKFKLGIHTGPLVAGIVGRKLPRFRLFGDTINTAARMMQKGEVGVLQFGEETHSYLPASIKTKLRGKVFMKGKGEVTTYLYDQAENRDLRSRRSSYQSAFDEVPDALTNGRGSSSYARRSRSTGTLGSLTPDSIVKRIHEEDDDDRWYKGVLCPADDAKEGEYQKWFHKRCFAKKFESRMKRQTTILIGLTASEIGYLFFIWRPCPRYAQRPLEMFSLFWLYLMCRLACLIIISAWWVVGRFWGGVMRNPRIVQNGILVSGLAVAVLTYISYDALPRPNCLGGQGVLGPVGLNATTYLDGPDVESSPVSGVSVNTLGLIAFPVFHRILSAHPYPFRKSCAFVVLAAGLMVLEKADIWIGQYDGIILPDKGKLIFAMMSGLFAFESYLHERNLRERFHAKTRVEETQKRINNILDTLMPQFVMSEIRNNPMGQLPSHEYHKATIAQSDLVGFTELASTRRPEEVVKIIGELFGRFDRLTDEHEIYKVETVGDAYIAGQAETLNGELLRHSTGSPCGKNLLLSVVHFSIRLVRETEDWSSENGYRLSCRVGIHTGECIGGIVGNKMQRYHLFGSLMTVVELLESTSEKGRVQLSSACKEAIDKELPTHSALDLSLEPRTESTLKTSKGDLVEYAQVGGPTYLVVRDSYH